MIEITEEQFDEYSNLKLRDRQSRARLSMQHIKTLEQDIDAPVRDTVAMLALLGCRVMWSCCGFDYPEQPDHKKHTLGQPYIMIHFDKESYSLAHAMFSTQWPYAGAWHILIRNHDGFPVLVLETNIARRGEWSDAGCIYFSELGSTYIQYLNDFLVSLSYKFADSVTIKDTNKAYRSKFPSWEYEPKSDWIVKRESYSRIGLEREA